MPRGVNLTRVFLMEETKARKHRYSKYMGTISGGEPMRLNEILANLNEMEGREGDSYREGGRSSSAGLYQLKMRVARPNTTEFNTLTFDTLSAKLTERYGVPIKIFEGGDLLKPPKKRQDESQKPSEEQRGHETKTQYNPELIERGLGDKTMIFLDAAYQVLKENDKAMHYNEITKEALNKGYVKTEGKTPETTMVARINSEIQKRGTKSRFTRVERGIYGLSEWEKKHSKTKPVAGVAVSNSPKEQISELDHDELILHLLELGGINGFKVDTGYSCDAYRLDAVWLAEYSDVPKYCFEVHISGSLHKDIAALKHAYDKWNSKIFLICTGEDLKVCERLISGSFHEIANRIKIIDAKEFFEYCQFKEKFKEINGLFG